MKAATPYRVHSFGVPTKGFCHALQAADGSYIAFNVDAETGAFIARACNAWEDAAALRERLEQLERAQT